MSASVLPEDRWITISGLALHYLDWGNPSATPMVLLHGLRGYAHYWDFFAPEMRGDYHVLALDQRGHGDSAWAASYGMDEYVGDIVEFAAELELEDMVLIGHSMGGISAIVYAALYPELVSRLVDVDIGPEFAGAGVARLQEVAESRPEAFDSEDAAAAYIRQTQPRYSEEFIRHEVKHNLGRDERGRLVSKCDPALLGAKVRSPEWLWQFLAQVSCPTLVLRGAESDLLREDTVQRMVATLPNCSVATITGAGHSVPADNPEAFATAVREFLLHYNAALVTG